MAACRWVWHRAVDAAEHVGKLPWYAKHIVVKIEGTTDDKFRVWQEGPGAYRSPTQRLSHNRKRYSFTPLHVSRESIYEPLAVTVVGNTFAITLKSYSPATRALDGEL